MMIKKASASKSPTAQHHGSKHKIYHVIYIINIPLAFNFNSKSCLIERYIVEDNKMLLCEDGDIGMLAAVRV